VKATTNTNLSAADVFYFGHLGGETGGRSSSASSGATVGADDLARTRGAASPAAVPVTNVFDHNRDGRVNAWDTSVTRANQLKSLPWLMGPTAPTASAPPVTDSAARDLLRRRTGFLLDDAQAS
jgi:hypothetical protein